MPPPAGDSSGNPNGAARDGSHRHDRHHINPYSPIQHIVVIVQENRSLNTIFAGFPGANTTLTGQESDGTVVPLTSVDLGYPQDIEHKYRDAKAAYNGGSMNGYNNEYLSDGKTHAGTFPYAYVNPAQVTPYWDIAKTWVLGDNFYPTEWGPSFTAHLNLIAGTTQTTTDAAVVDFPSNANGPWGCDFSGNGDVVAEVKRELPSEYGTFSVFHAIPHASRHDGPKRGYLALLRSKP